MDTNKEIESKYPLIEQYRRRKPTGEDFPASPGSIMHDSVSASESRQKAADRMSYRQYQQNVSDRDPNAAVPSRH